jgi:soluble lytic murein transglycosylase-like protein
MGLLGQAACHAALAVLLLARPSARADSLLVPTEFVQTSSRPAGDPVERWRDLIAEAAARFAVSVNWIRAVMRAESGGRPEFDGRPVTSRVGAMGLMQIMPQTYDALRARFGLGGDPYDPRDNILAGAAYLRELYDRYGYPNVFAAYNAGPGRLEKYLTTSRPLPNETSAYLATLGGFDTGLDGRELGGSDVRLFSMPQTTPAPSGGVSLFVRAPPSGALFIPLRAARD